MCQELELGQSLQMTSCRAQLSQGIPCDCGHQKKRKGLEMPPGADSIKATQKKQKELCTDEKRAMQVRVQNPLLWELTACICAVNIRKGQEWLWCQGHPCPSTYGS